MAYQELKKLGFSDKEAAIYVAVLKRGKASPATIARETNINRTTVYAAAKGLVKRGVISEDLGSKIRYFVAEPVESLKGLADQERRQADAKEQVIARAMNELKVLSSNRTYDLPRIKFVEEDRIEQYLFQQTPQWMQTATESDSTWWGFQDSSFAKLFPKWITWTWKRFPKQKARILSNETTVDTRVRKVHPERHIKYWKKAKSFTGSTWVIGSHIVMLYTNDRPFYLVDIQDAVIAQNMRAIFKNLWEEVR